MRKQTNRNIKAHLLRGVSYLILLVAVCVIPLALGQRAATKQSAVADPLLLGSTPVTTLSNSDDPAGGTWTLTGSLNTERAVHTATLLPNGKVLIAGGINSSATVFASAELYDPASGTWTTTGSLNFGRFDDTATLLANGMVLVAGGDYIGGFRSSSELYDPASGSWTTSGTLNVERAQHTATLLPNGKVLIAGGINSSATVFASAELYDPASGTWTFTGSLNNTAHRLHTATLLPNGKVLVAGGLDSSFKPSASAELYDLASATWSVTGSLNTGRYEHTATLLPNGMVLVAGGLGSSAKPSASAELYDPASETWSVTGRLNTARNDHTATLLPDGTVLVAGGEDNSFKPSASAELYDPASRTWSVTDGLNTARAVQTATLLPSGTVLVAGGFDSSFFALASAELYVSAPPSHLGNISTRAFVQTGDNVVIGGFIVQGTEPKRVIIRAIGPELAQYGVPNPLANPTLELHDGTGALIASNNNWVSTIIGGIITSNQVHEIQASGYAPGDTESAIIADLPAGNYTAIVSGVNNMTGVALVEMYDLSPDTTSILGNISNRAFVQTGDNVMIEGFIVEGSQPKRVIIRAIGPELTQYGVPDALANPTLELHDGTGALIASNNNWVSTIIGGIITSNQVHEIQASGYAPGDPRESAIIADLSAGNYTAIVSGVNNMTGVALVEVYDLQ